VSVVGVWMEGAIGRSRDHLPSFAPGTRAKLGALHSGVHPSSRPSAPRTYQDNHHCARHTANTVHVSRRISHDSHVNATTATWRQTNHKIQLQTMPKSMRNS
jgi:hypothetical protein